MASTSRGQRLASPSSCRNETLDSSSPKGGRSPCPATNDLWPLTNHRSHGSAYHARPAVEAPAMPQKPNAPDSDAALSRKRTADLLKELRHVQKKARMLRREVDYAEDRDTAAHRARVI